MARGKADGGALKRLPDSSDKPIECEFDIAYVDGEYGRHLADDQVDAILEVLEWFNRPPEQPATTKNRRNSRPG
jgi:hypothetical protein